MYWPTRIFTDHRCVIGIMDDSCWFVYWAGGIQQPRCLSSFKNKTKTDQWFKSSRPRNLVLGGLLSFICTFITEKFGSDYSFKILKLVPFESDICPRPFSGLLNFRLRIWNVYLLVTIDLADWGLSFSIMFFTDGSYSYFIREICLLSVLVWVILFLEVIEEC